MTAIGKATVLGQFGDVRKGVVEALLTNGEVEKANAWNIKQYSPTRQAVETTRRLYRLSSGGVLLDIPGIRLLDLTIGQEGLDDAFPDITELAQHCRFSDCSHSGDDGCAVEQAVRDGVLPL